MERLEVEGLSSTGAEGSVGGRPGAGPGVIGRIVMRLPILLPVLLLACVEPPPLEIYRPPANYARPLPPGVMALERVRDPREWPDLAAGFENRVGLEHAVRESLAYFAKPSSMDHYPYLGISHTRARATLEAFLEDLQAARSGADLEGRLRKRYELYRSVGCDGRGTVLFTGYFEPIYRGSRTPDATYRYPLYRLPDDVVKDPEGRPLGRRAADGTVTPYPTRREIEEQGLLEGKGLELVYLADPLEAYLIRVQGSARIRLPDGQIMRVGYAGKTDRPYRSVGQALVRAGKVGAGEQSLQAIKRHFARHPEELKSALWEDESYVFFRETEGGPYGSINAVVTPMHTIATDKSVFPRGCLAFVQTRLPVGGAGATAPNALTEAGPPGEGATTSGSRPFNAFVLDQDTGGAIRSAGRTDIFIGTGPDAEAIAGGVKYEGRLYYIFLRPGHVRETGVSPAAEGA